MVYNQLGLVELMKAKKIRIDKDLWIDWMDRADTRLNADPMHPLAKYLIKTEGRSWVWLIADPDTKSKEQ